jgi:CheY-like chemotaxis protein
MSEIKVLVVEDNDADVYLIKQAFQEHGLDVSIIASTMETLPKNTSWAFQRSQELSAAHS